MLSPQWPRRWWLCGRSSSWPSGPASHCPTPPATRPCPPPPSRPCTSTRCGRLPAPASARLTSCLSACLSPLIGRPPCDGVEALARIHAACAPGLASSAPRGDCLPASALPRSRPLTLQPPQPRQLDTCSREHFRAVLGPLPRDRLRRRRGVLVGTTQPSAGLGAWQAPPVCPSMWVRRAVLAPQGPAVFMPHGGSGCASEPGPSRSSHNST